jgi:hypothetical protein
MPDDGYVHVPLQFGFPFYGQVFTNSWMFDNGIVAFMDPIGTQANYYWNSEQFGQGLHPRFNYMIAPLWTDLYPGAGSSYTTQGNSQLQRYTWTNLGEYYNPNNLNTFSLEIRPSGYIGVEYTMINLSLSNASVGTTGNLTLGEYNQVSFYPAGTQITTSLIQNWSVNSTGDICNTDPLSDISCPGYEDAFFNQQCLINPLYNSLCPGYDQAFYLQQCSINPLYDSGCSGYFQAYFNQQCSLDPLYDPTCPGYEEKVLSLIPKEESTTSVTQTTEVALSSDGTIISPAEVLVVEPVVASVIAPKEEVKKQTTKKEEPKQTPAPQQTRQATRQQTETKKEETKEELQQSQTVTAMGIVPNFTAYSVTIPDAPFYRPYEIYKGQQTVDNRNASRGLIGPSDSRHNEMINQQYK